MYTFDGVLQIPLMYRMATDLDQKDPHAEKRSRYLWKVRSTGRLLFW
jgi:hypothetical protein